MTYSFQNPSQEVIFDYIRTAKTIAVVGLSDRTETAAYEVSQVMQSAIELAVPLVADSSYGDSWYEAK